MNLEHFLTVQGVKESEGDRFLGVFVLRKRTTKVARNGSAFYMLELGDRTGSFVALCFSGGPLFEFFGAVEEGAILKVLGQKEFYQERLSPKLIQVRVMQPEEWAPLSEQLIEVAPEPEEALWAEFLGFIEKIEHPPLKKTVELALAAIEARFRLTPGAIAMHHAYRHGLLEHTVHVARVCVALLPRYPIVHADLALAGVLLHDIGKALEYEGDMKARKSQLGTLQGHVVLGFRMAREAALEAALDPPLLERLEHIILSHQGELEWGAAVLPATPEAVFVSLCDNLDAKMGMVERTLRTAPEDQVFSELIPGLRSPLLTKSL